MSASSEPTQSQATISDEPPVFATPEEEMEYWKNELARINDSHSTYASTQETESQQQHVPLRDVDRGDNTFLNSIPEIAATNQYWYSAATIAVLANEALQQSDGGPIGCISTPSVFFSLPKAAQDRSYVFDFDEQFADKTQNFVRYDFNQPLDFPSRFRHYFEVLVIDPPFITKEVWERYTVTAKELLAPGGKLLCTTISENAEMMQKLLGVESQRFRPSIPNLVYQYVFGAALLQLTTFCLPRLFSVRYNVYTNFSSHILQQPNPEVDDALLGQVDSSSVDETLDPHLSESTPQ